MVKIQANQEIHQRLLMM